MLEQDDIQKIITAQREVFVTKTDLAEFRDEGRTFSSDIQSALEFCYFIAGSFWFIVDKENSPERSRVLLLTYFSLLLFQVRYNIKAILNRRKSSLSIKFRKVNLQTKRNGDFE